MKKIKVRWEVECRRVFVETGEVTKNGKDKLMPIDIRALYFDGDFVGPKRYKVTATRRGGQYRFSIHYIPELEKAQWNTLPLPIQPEPTWKRLKEPNGKVRSYSEQEIKEELTRYMGEQGEGALWTLLTAIPEKIAA